MQEFTQTFTMNENTDNGVSICFEFGDISGWDPFPLDVVIDDVIIQENN